MSPEFYQYLKQLHSFVEYQEKKLKNLEKTVAGLQKELKRMKKRPPVQVGNIEYKFDQLKVEKLEGTLSIGLNPAELQGIEDFAVDNKNIQAPGSPKDMFMRSIDIEKTLIEFLETELPGIIQSACEKLNIQADESYQEFIKEDIKKQLPNRIAAHSSEMLSQRNQGESEQEFSSRIAETMKEEIKSGVVQFLQQLPKG